MLGAVDNCGPDSDEAGPCLWFVFMFARAGQRGSEGRCAALSRNVPSTEGLVGITALAWALHGDL